MKPTVTSLRPAFCSASMIRTQASAVGASGFSQSTGLPASIEVITSGSCTGPKLVTSTASTSLDAMSAAAEAWTVAPRGSATRVALAASTSKTATTLPRESSFSIRAMCARPMPPGPMIPIRTLISVSPRLWAWSEQTEAAGRQELARHDGVGQGKPRVAGVQVLLADDVELLVQARERLDELLHVRRAGRRTDRRTRTHGLDERPVLLVRLPRDVHV